MSTFIMGFVLLLLLFYYVLLLLHPELQPLYVYIHIKFNVYVYSYYGIYSLQLKKPNQKTWLWMLVI